jgi:flagellar L-ring protein precursor FlgH
MRTLTGIAGILLCIASAHGQSLWRDRASLIADPTARAVGDILTINISERQKVEQDDKTRTEKSSEFRADVNSFNIAPDAFNSPLPNWNITSRRKNDTTGQIQRNGTVTMTLSAVVIDVLPNGNMLIRGRRTINMDGERKTMELTGIVRRMDIESDNSITSACVADANISYVSEGTLSRQTTKGPVADALDFLFWLVWPF